MREFQSSAAASRLPIQGRSRASTDRMLASATALFLTGGYEAVTASDVARGAGVAVGTIYGRFGSKDGLVIAVQTALLARFEEAVSALAASPEWTHTPPAALIPTLIGSLAQLLGDHASMLQPIMQHAAVSAETARLGKRAYENLRRTYLAASERVWPLVRHEDPVGAIESCFTIAYATFARALGLGTAPDAADPASVPRLATQLGAMCEAYLMRPVAL